VTGEASARAKAKVINELVLTLARLPVLQLEIVKNPQNGNKKEKKNNYRTAFSFTNRHSISLVFTSTLNLIFTLTVSVCFPQSTQ
jgi:hypothetical protein